MATPVEGQKPAVLIVDDQPFYTTMFRGVLEQHGFRVLVANSGPDGLKLAKNHKPDIIVLDIEMPGMDGFAVCQKLKEDADVKDIPVMILTGTNNPKMNEKSFKAGADITALKALSSERLVNTIRIALNKGKPPAQV
jgi:CheY-like chemotaxis protein